MNQWNTWEDYGNTLGRRVSVLKRTGFISLAVGVVCAVLAFVLWFQSVAFDPALRCLIVVSGFGFGLAFVTLFSAWNWARQVRWYTSGDSRSPWRRMGISHYSQRNNAGLIVAALLVFAICVGGIIRLAPFLFDFSMSDDISSNLFTFVLTGFVLTAMSLCTGMILALFAFMIVSIHDTVLLRRASGQSAPPNGSLPAPAPYAPSGGLTPRGPQTWEQYGQWQRKKASLLWKFGLTGVLAGLMGGISSVLQWVQGVGYQPAIHATILTSGLVFSLGVVAFIYGLLLPSSVRSYDNEERRWQFEHSVPLSEKVIRLFWVVTIVVAVLVLFSLINDLNFTFDYDEYGFTDRSVLPFLRFMWHKLWATTLIQFCLGNLAMVAMMFTDIASWRRTLQRINPA